MADLPDSLIDELDQCDREQQAANLLLRAAQMQREAATRISASQDLMEFCEYVDDLYRRAPHLELIANALAEVEKFVQSGGTEGTGRLLISMPPRHGKTTTVAKRWPAYLLGRHSDWRMALVSYGAELSEDASRAVRSLLRDEPRYHHVFPNTVLSDESRAINRWSVAGRSPDNPSVVAVGVGGPLTGRGFQVIIIDDPIKNRQDAESEVMRKGLKDWYRGTLRTRLEPGGAIVIIMTRWHEDDLVGWLESQQKIGEGEDWTVLNLPALAEEKDSHGNKIDDPLGRKDGDALWHERYPRAILTETKRALGSYDWESQYQGHPKPPAGSKIMRDWFKTIEADEVPKGLVWVRYWDLAISTKPGSSYTASSRVAFDEEGNMYVASMIRGHWEWPTQRKIMKETMKAEAALGVLHGVESALHGTAAVQQFRREKDLRGIPMKGVDVHVDKLTRALNWIALAEDGKVILVRGAWVSDFLDEAAAFTGKNDLYDDQVDTVSGGDALYRRYYGDRLKTGKNPFYG